MGASLRIVTASVAPATGIGDRKDYVLPTTIITSRRAVSSPARSSLRE